MDDSTGATDGRGPVGVGVGLRAVKAGTSGGLRGFDTTVGEVEAFPGRALVGTGLARGRHPYRCRRDDTSGTK